jgi:hypothetical protein
MCMHYNHCHRATAHLQLNILLLLLLYFSFELCLVMTDRPVSVASQALVKVQNIFEICTLKIIYYHAST